MGEGLLGKAGQWLKDQLISSNPAENDVYARSDVSLDQAAAPPTPTPDTTENKKRIILGSHDNRNNVRTDIKEIIDYQGELTDEQTNKLLNGSARIRNGEYTETSY